MVKKFNEFIEEGFLSKTISRSKSGEKRLGDITEFDKYLKTVEWVDIGHPKYLFAKYDCEKYFDVKDIENIINELPKNIKIAGKKEFDYLTKCDCTIDKDPKTKLPIFKYSSPNQKEDMVYCIVPENSVSLMYLNKIFSVMPYNGNAKVRIYEFKSYKYPNAETFIITIPYTPKVKYLSIKLIKEK